VNVQAEAAINVGTTAAFTAPTTAFGSFTGTTTLNYKIRAGSASAKVTVSVAEFSPTTGPSVAAGDLSFTSASEDLGTGVSSTVASTTAKTVLTFGNGDKSANGGASATVSWSLADQPQYTIASYSAVATFTISAT
jgi:hypothetical protein